MMKYHLHKSIPSWMLKAVTEITCNECNEPILKESILGIGLKEIKDKKLNIFIEYQCPNCQHSARMNFSSQLGTIEEMCYFLLDEVQKKRVLQKTQDREEPSKRRHSELTAEEAKKFVKSMHATTSYEEFLKLIGADKMIENEEPNTNDQPKT